MILRAKSVVYTANSTYYNSQLNIEDDRNQRLKLKRSSESTQSAVGCVFSCVFTQRLYSLSLQRSYFYCTSFYLILWREARPPQSVSL